MKQLKPYNKINQEFFLLQPNITKLVVPNAKRNIMAMMYGMHALKYVIMVSYG
jgi:hypothetical protein